MSVSALREDDTALKEETALLFPAQRSPESGQGRTEAKPVPQPDKGSGQLLRAHPPGWPDRPLSQSSRAEGPPPNLLPTEPLRNPRVARSPQSREGRQYLVVVHCAEMFPIGSHSDPGSEYFVPFVQIMKTWLRTSLVVQWLRLGFHFRGSGFNPWSGK